MAENLRWAATHAADIDAGRYRMADAVLIPGTPIFGCPSCFDPWESEPSCSHYDWDEQGHMHVRCWVCPDRCPVGDCQRDTRPIPPGVDVPPTADTPR